MKIDHIISININLKKPLFSYQLPDHLYIKPGMKILLNEQNNILENGIYIVKYNHFLMRAEVLSENQKLELINLFEELNFKLVDPKIKKIFKQADKYLVNMWERIEIKEEIYFINHILLSSIPQINLSIAPISKSLEYGTIDYEKGKGAGIYKIDDRDVPLKEVIPKYFEDLTESILKENFRRKK